MIARDDITGLVLAGGRGSRMGGVDKGLQAYRGTTLARHALERLAPQVGHLFVSANRHAAIYAAMGVPVLPDALPDHPGPLAGVLAGLQRCPTRYLMTVPCDAPVFPIDLVERLAHTLVAHDAALALPVTWALGGSQRHPVFCLMDVRVTESLQRFLQGGQHQAGRWAAEQGAAELRVDDAEAGAFANANTLAELAQLDAAP